MGLMPMVSILWRLGAQILRNKLEALHNEDMNFLSNEEVNPSNYPTQGGNKGWDRDE